MEEENLFYKETGKKTTLVFFYLVYAMFAIKLMTITYDNIKVFITKSLKEDSYIIYTARENTFAKYFSCFKYYAYCTN